jgi:tetratricopeptide (TPR) repeat protein
MVAAGNVHLRSLEVRVCTVGGDYARAQAKADDLIADLRNQKLPESDAATIYDAAGVAYLYSEKYDRAKEMYDKVLAARPQSVEALDILATICAENLSPPDFKQAEAYTERAMELFDRNEAFAADILDTKGWVMVLSGNVDEGQLVLQSAAERARSPLTHYHLAKAAQLQGRNTECRNELKLAQKLMDQMADERRFVDPRLRRKVESMLSDLPEAEK